MLRGSWRLGWLSLVLAACGQVGDSGDSEGTQPTTETTADATTEPTTTDELATTGTPSDTTTGEPTTGEPTTDGSSTGPGLPPPAETIEEALDGIDGLEWIERPAKIDGYRSFVLYYLQPADHGDPDGQTFVQKITLLHRDAGAPMVLSTDGYRLYTEYQTLAEPAALLDANYLQVEHRFFADSRPTPTDWSLLTIEQAAADHHRITVALKQAFYRAPWLATGVSKGGMAATYFRRFYPDDVAGTVAYVAPLNQGMADSRYWPYIEATEPACTEALVTFAREVLLRRDAMLTWVESEAVQAGHAYTLITADQALEISATRVPFSFWQYETAADCEDVPPPAADDALVWQFLRRVHAPNRLRDDRLASYEPYYWQAASQLGAPAGDEAAFADLLLYPGLDAPINLLGPGKTPTFDPASMQDLADWMASDATAMLFIYGENDPWTAAAYEADASRDVHRFIAPGGNHGAEIAGLTDADRALAHERLEAWTGVAPHVRPRPDPLPLREPL